MFYFSEHLDFSENHLRQDSLTIFQSSTIPQPQDIPPRPVQLAPYDYLALLPGLVTAATPVLLCWLQLKYNGKKA